MKDFYKILSGKIFIKVNGSVLVIEPFSIDDRYMAEIISQEEYDQAFESGCLTEDETISILMDQGWWSGEDELQLIQIPKNIDQMKVDYYNNFHSESTKQYIKDNIKIQKNRFHELLVRKNYLYSYTCEYVKTITEQSFLVERSTFLKDGSRADFSLFPVSKVLFKFNDEMLNDEEIRQVAKSPICRSSWVMFKNGGKFFQNTNYTEMQLSLVNWLMVYDSVYDSTECPNENVIADDIALDGWLIVRRKKYEEERKKGAGDKYGKNSGCGEIFIPAHNKEDVEQIYNMNSHQAKRQVKLLEQDLDKKGSVDEKERSGVKENLGMLANQIMFAKGKK